MRISRRAFALVATFAVAFGSLWPLVSVARPADPSIPVFICTQAGFQDPSIPADHGDKFHCPLCVVSMDPALPGSPQAIALPLPHDAPVIAQFTSSLHPPLLTRPPPSRAPPSHS